MYVVLSLLFHQVVCGPVPRPPPKATHWSGGRGGDQGAVLGGGALINMHVANGGYLRHVIGYEEELLIDYSKYST